MFILLLQMGVLLWVRVCWAAQTGAVSGLRSLLLSVPESSETSRVSKWSLQRLWVWACRGSQHCEKLQSSSTTRKNIAEMSGLHIFTFNESRQMQRMSQQLGQTRHPQANPELLPLLHISTALVSLLSSDYSNRRGAHCPQRNCQCKKAVFAGG